MPLMAALLQRLHEGRIETAGHALVDARGIDEAVAKHDLAALDRRADHLLDMVGARGGEKQGLHFRSERLGGSGQDHMAHRFGARRAARLARHEDIVALVAQLPGQPVDLRRLAGAFPAFEGDEKSAAANPLGPFQSGTNAPAGTVLDPRAEKGPRHTRSCPNASSRPSALRQHRARVGAARRVPPFRRQRAAFPGSACRRSRLAARRPGPLLHRREDRALIDDAARSIGRGW